MSPNGYYNYRKHRMDARKKKKASVLRLIREMYHEAQGRPGYRMMKDMLAFRGICLSAQTVHRYMNTELGLRSVTRKARYRCTKGPDAYGLFDNLLDRDFSADERNRRWCIDFTYLPLKGGRRYNCTVIDLYDRRVAASVNSSRINTRLAIDAVKKAMADSGIKGGLLLHSDQGSQFTSKEFIEFCREHGITQSMSRAGCPYDNAPMERYFNTMKAELISLRTFSDEKTLYTEVNAYAYGWYNNLRPHSYNGGTPPAKVS